MNHQLILFNVTIAPAGRWPDWPHTEWGHNNHRCPEEEHRC